MVVARKGRGTWRVKVAGRASHAGSKLGDGANAIVQLGRVLEHIHGFTDPKRNLTFNVATVRGRHGAQPRAAGSDRRGRVSRIHSRDLCRCQGRNIGPRGRGDIVSAIDQFPAQIDVEIQGESRPWPRNANTDALAKIWQKSARKLGIRPASKSAED